MLLIDTNVLIRCSQGRAMVRLQAIQARAVRVATTDRNAGEFGRKLVEVLGRDEEDAWTEDRDFFGVGVPIWSTHNVQFAE